MSSFNTQSNTLSLNIVTALNCEAKPLIDFYRLSKINSKPFDYYVGESTSGSGEQFKINLLVSGLGGLNMSTACGWLASQTNQARSVWLNLGSAGHKTLETGTVVRVQQVVDMQSGKSHLPAMTAKWQGVNSALITYQSTCVDYPEEALVDMEGSAFFSSAGMFTTTEFIQSVKIVSDNEIDSVERLNAALISQLIAPHVQSINDFALNLLALLIPVDGVEHCMQLAEHLHCTVSQRQQFFDVLNKLKSLHQLDKQTNELLKSADSMTELLQSLNARLQSVQPSLSEMVS